MTLLTLESHEMVSTLQGLYNTGALIVAITPRELVRDNSRSTDYRVKSFNVFYVTAGSR
jgi:hypothetical protein